MLYLSRINVEQKSRVIGHNKLKLVVLYYLLEMYKKDHVLERGENWLKFIKSKTLTRKLIINLLRRRQLRNSLLRMIISHHGCFVRVHLLSFVNRNRSRSDPSDEKQQHHFDKTQNLAGP